MLIPDLFEDEEAVDLALTAEAGAFPPSFLCAAFLAAFSAFLAAFFLAAAELGSWVYVHVLEFGYEIQQWMSEKQ